MTKPSEMPGWPECAITENNLWALLDYERNRADAWEARCRALHAAIKSHNDACEDMCGHGEKEAESCGYRPYLLGSHRRCPTCPRDDMLMNYRGDQRMDVAIDLPPQQQRTGDV